MTVYTTVTVCRTVTVHQYLAGNQPHVAGRGRLEHGIRGMCVYGREYQRRGRAVADQLVDENAR